MDTLLLRTKFYIPPPRPELVARPHLIERLNGGPSLGRKLTLLSAPAGFGKTTLVGEWVNSWSKECDVGSEEQASESLSTPYREASSRPLLGSLLPTPRLSWLSLDESDNDPTRFLTYLITALQAVEVDMGTGVLSALQGPQPPPSEAILTALINKIAAISTPVVLVLDDYHLIDAQSVHDALAFLLQHLPPGMHLVIATREDPPLPLARLRARGQLTELRAVDLRFSSSEAAAFLNQAMGLGLSAEDVAALENRTEGWIAGLQLAAISLQGSRDTTGFIQSFTGSHRYVLDYLVQEILEQQPESIQRFLLHTSILDRLTGSLCDAVCGASGRDTPSGQQTLEALERANLFIVPLDDERRWFRYHHLFADLLRQQLHQGIVPSAGDAGIDVDKLHKRASEWYEENGLQIEAFHHAAAANDIERAERLIDGDGMPLYYRGASTPVLNWLKSLPTTVLDAYPALWATYAMTSLAAGETADIEDKLNAAERALEGAEVDGRTRDLVGRIANTRANLAVGHQQVETIIAQSRRALAYLHPDNLTFRTAVTWKLGVAYELREDRVAARQAYNNAIASSEASGNTYIHVLATVGMAGIQLADNQLVLAFDTYEHALELVGDLPIPVGPHVHFCLARICYEWNDLDGAQQHDQTSLQLSEPYKDQYDIAVACELLLARLKLAQGDVSGASSLLAQADRSARRHNFALQIPEIVATQVQLLLQQGDLAAAADLADEYDLPLVQAQVCLAQEDTDKALALLEPLRQEAEARSLEDKRLKVMVLQAVALRAHGKEKEALKMLGDALELAEPGGFVRIFVDKGPPMARLLHKALSCQIAPDYVGRLLAAFSSNEPKQVAPPKSQARGSDLVEPLSERELEVLALIAEGLTNPEIASRLFLSLNTVKVHARNIYGKLGVNNRTQAATQAQSLGLLDST